MLPWGSHLVTFLVGVATGAAGSYFADKYTDVRRVKEADAAARQKFERVRQEMPDLIREIRADMAAPEAAAVRDFFVAPNRNVMLTARTSSFMYYESEHLNLRAKIAILENCGYVTDITPGNAPKYRMSEEFVERLRSP